MNDLKQLANRLMSHESGENKSNLPSAIFGTAGSLANIINIGKKPVRIAMYPIINTDKPNVAMGISMILATLLERWDEDITVYRLCSRLEGEVESYSWSITQSQFGPDDWSLEQLDDNVVLYGKLTFNENTYTLNLILEGDINTTTDSRTLIYEFSDLFKLVAELPRISEIIAELLIGSKREISIPAYEVTQFQSESDIRLLEDFLDSVFRWELALLLYLYGKSEKDLELKERFDALLKAGKNLGAFGDWSLIFEVNRFLKPGFLTIHGEVLSRIQEIVSTPLSATFMAYSLFQLGLRDQAFDLLEAAIEEQPDYEWAYLILAKLYRQSGYLTECLEVYQAAIEQEFSNPDLYLQYSSTLLLAGYSVNFEGLSSFAFIDPVEMEREGIDEDDFLVEEAIESYYEALELDKNNIDALYGLLYQLLDLDDTDPAEFWDHFEKLIEIDTQGDKTRAIVDLLYQFEELEPGIDILRKRLSKQAVSFLTHINLAVLYLHNDETSRAVSILNDAKTLATKPEEYSLLEELLVKSETSEFDERVGEMETLLDAGKKLQPSDVEFLEELAPKAPHFSFIHHLLARAYENWNEMDAALETALDALETTPDEPSLLELAGKLIWESGDKILAFQYLNRGLTNYPNHVPLLTRVGEYLFDEGDLDQARYFLRRAENINPRHPRFIEVRNKIARAGL